MFLHQASAGGQLHAETANHKLLFLFLFCKAIILLIFKYGFVENIVCSGKNKLFTAVYFVFCVGFYFVMQSDSSLISAELLKI